MGEGQKGSPKICDRGQVQARCSKIQWLVETGGGPELTDGASRSALASGRDPCANGMDDSFGVGSSTHLWSHCRLLSLWDSDAAYLSIIADGQEFVSIIPSPSLGGTTITRPLLRDGVAKLFYYLVETCVPRGHT